MKSSIKENCTTAKNKKSRIKTRKKRNVNGKLSISKVIEAISGTGGIVSQVAEKLQCSRQAVYDYKEKYDEVRRAFDDEEDTILDVCEEGLFAKIYSQDFDAIKYYFSKKGHKRGYGEGPNPGGIKNEEKQSGVLVVPARLSGSEWEDAAQKAAARKRQAEHEIP